MRLATFDYLGREQVGAVKDGRLVDLTPLFTDMVGLIQSGPAGLEGVAALVAETAEGLDLDRVRLLAPIPRPPRNVMCLGLNYAEHAAEHYTASGRQAQLPEAPIIFTKAGTAVNGPYDDIPYPATATRELDWEVELAVIIGRSGKDIPAERAMDYVFGYTVLNDISARDLQRQGKQYFKGKSLDGACPMGPWIVTADEIGDPHALRLTCRVNEMIKQDGRTADMIFRVPAIISYLSQGMTLLPGDLIATGTPSGVGFARQPPEFLQPGDVVECEIEHIGRIRNRVGSAG